MATRLFIGNLPDNTAEDDLRNAFCSYGEITNLDLKSKSAAGSEKKFAFVTISGSNYDIETCIKHFSNEDFNGNRLYVTRARESFLERLQRERLEAQQKEAEKDEEQKVAKKLPILKLGEKLNPRKRKIEETIPHHRDNHPKIFEKNGDGPDMSGKVFKTHETKHDLELGDITHKKAHKDRHDSTNVNTRNNKLFNNTKFQNGGNPMGEKRSSSIMLDKKKQDSDYKRMEAMKKKSQEFKQKKMIVKTGLTDVDKAANKKIIFSDSEGETKAVNGYENRFKKNAPERKKSLFDNDDDDSGDELNFEIKKQFEGKQGQKVLDLQSRYKSDKRFVLDERFIEDEMEPEKDQGYIEGEQIELNQADEKAKQLNILQDVLGVPIRKKISDEEREGKRNKPRLGMLRFDPSQPDHAKFLAPIEDIKHDSTKKTKKKKDKQIDNEIQEPPIPEEPRPEVSKEQFYKMSDTLKEAIAQPSAFSLRSLFGNTEPAEKETIQEEDYIPLEPPKKSKIKNPLQPGERNPFVYDSSDSETEETEKETKTATAPVLSETKAVWKENFFFGLTDQRFEEGLAFFSRPNDAAHKERRELKSLMKKRIYNKERKDQMQMFRKKIGGRKKSMKKSFRRKT